MRRLIELILAVSSLVFVSCQSSVAQSINQSLDDRKILVESFVISGTQAVDSAELAEITDSMSGSTFNDDAEELGERIRAQFQDHGYFKAEMQKLDIKVIDPLASPKPVRLEAKVSEGPRYRLSSIEFTGNHAVSTLGLRAEFPIKVGDVFARSKIAGGLKSMRRLYSSRGFLDFTCVPDTKLDSGLRLNIEVQEGPQYRMDRLEISGPLRLRRSCRRGGNSRLGQSSMVATWKLSWKRTVRFFRPTSPNRTMWSCSGTVAMRQSPCTST